MNKGKYHMDFGALLYATIRPVELWHKYLGTARIHIAWGTVLPTATAFQRKR